MGELVSTAVVLAGIILVTVVLVRVSDRLTRKAYAPLVQRFGFEHTTNSSGRPDPLAIQGDWNGLPVRIWIAPGGRHSPTRLIFALSPRTPLGVPGEIHVRRRRVVDRVAVGVGLARRLWKRSYRDWGPAFVEADDDRYAEALVANSRFRQTALPLLRFRRPSLSIESQEIRLTLAGPLRFQRRNLKPQEVQRVLEQLEAVAKLDYPDAAELPADPSPEHQAKSDHVVSLKARLQGSRWRFVILPMTFGAALLMFIGPLVLWWGSSYPPLTWDLHRFGLTLGTGATLVYAVLLIPFVRGYSRSLNTYTTFLFFALVGFPAFFAGAPVVLNGLADRSAPMQVTGVIRDMQEERAVVAVPLLEVGRGEGSVHVDARVHDALTVGDPIRVRIRHGALGFPWFDSDLRGR